MGKKEHFHPSSPQIECEKCGGMAKMVDASYPKSFVCVCKKCGHRFKWVSANDSPYS